MKTHSLSWPLIIMLVAVLAVGASCNKQQQTTNQAETTNTAVSTDTKTNTNSENTATINAEDTSKAPSDASSEQMIHGMSEVIDGRYVNHMYKFSFAIPDGYEVYEEKIDTLYGDGSSWLWLSMYKTADNLKRNFHMDVNPDGYGPFFPQQKYMISEGSDHSLNIDSTETQTYSDEDSAIYTENNTSYTTSLLEADNGNSYFFWMSYDSDDVDLHEEFEEILTSVEFDPPTADIDVKPVDTAYEGWSQDFIVTADNTEVARIIHDTTYQIIEEFDMDQYYYVGFLEAEIGGYIPFPINSELYRINKKTYVIEELGVVGSVSLDETLAARTGEEELTITNLDSLAETTYPVSIDFNAIGKRQTSETTDSRIGAPLISLDNQHVAFTAMNMNIPENETITESSIFLFTIAENTLTELASSNGVITPSDWRSPRTLYYEDEYGQRQFENIP